MKIVASFEKTVQTSEDSWGVRLQTLLCDESTTVGQIRDWQRENLHVRTIEGYKMDDIKLTEAETIVCR